MNALTAAGNDFVPISIEVEQALIGSVLMQNDVFFAVADTVEPEMFSEAMHRDLWMLLADRITRGDTVTPITMMALMGKDATVTIAGELTAGAYIARLAAAATSIMLAPEYAKTIRDLWSRRRILELARDLKDRALGGIDSGDVETLLDDADQELSSIRFGKNIDGVMSLDQAMAASVNYTSKVYQGVVDIGLTTGIDAIDAMLGPMMPGDLVTALGASGHGKTALVAQILKHNAMPSLDANQSARRGLFFSMEMEGVQIARRIIAAETGITTQRQKAASIMPAEFEFLTDAARKLGPLPVMLDETPGQTTARIVRKARAIKRRHKDLALIAVDHLLEIRPEHPRWSKIDTVENAVQELKRLAKELQVVVILLAQATREGQKREHWRLRTIDLWGGDRIKQSSDMVLSIGIPSVWLAEREPDSSDQKSYDKWVQQCFQWKDKAEIGAPKVRDGESGRWATVGFDGPRALFSDL